MITHKPDAPDDSPYETLTHNDVNELTDRTIGESEIDLTYDDAGNLIQDGDADGDHKYVYDFRNRLIEVEEYQTDTWNAVAEYKYDALGRRVLKIVTNKGRPNGTTRFLRGGRRRPAFRRCALTPGRRAR